jgi:hypothetical protein
MWKVENVKSVKNGHGFHITSLDGKPVVLLFAYETQAEAKAARTHVQSAVEKAGSLLPSASPFQIEDALFFEARYVRSQTADASQFR